MSDDQIKERFANDIKEIKESLKELSLLVTDMRIEIAEGYLKKFEYNEKIKEIEKKINKAEDACVKRLEDHKKEERSYSYKILGIGFTAFSAVFGIVQWVYKLASGN
jgi:DNA gyrase/topoisomerase IV subunit B